MEAILGLIFGEIFNNNFVAEHLRAITENVSVLASSSSYIRFLSRNFHI